MTPIGQGDTPVAVELHIQDIADARAQSAATIRPTVPALEAMLHEASRCSTTASSA